MAYTKTMWSDRSVEKPRTYTEAVNGDGTKTFTPSEGTIYNAGTKVNAANMNKIEQGIADVDAAVNNHLADYVRQIGYGTTAGTANTYTLTLTPALTAYVAGVGVTVKINVANTGASTINVNGLGAKSILDSKGNAMTSGKLRLNGVYTLRYDGTNFILQGEGGDLAKLPNLIKNGSFENDTNCWVGEGTGVTLAINTSTYKFGAKAVNLYCPASVAEGFLVQYGINYIQGHKYYVRYWVCSTVANKWSDVFFPLTGTYPSSTVSCPIAYTWYLHSFISEDPTIVSGSYGLRLDNNNANAAVTMIFDGIMLLDLTDAYGAGNEPSQAEMDAFVQANGGWWDSDLAALTADATLDPTLMLVGQKGYDDGISKVGTMVDRRFGSVGNYTPAKGVQGNTLAENLFIQPEKGYYDDLLDGAGRGAIRVSDPDFIPSNILSGKNIFGLQGSIPDKNSANSAATNISTQAGRLYLKPPTGYYDQNGANSWVYRDDANFIAGNIANGVPIFGLTGTNTNKKWQEVQIQSSMSTITFNRRFGGSDSLYYITLAGLSFVPKTVIIKSWGMATNEMYTNQAMCYVDFSSYPYAYMQSANLYFTSSGFQLPVPQTGLYTCIITG